MKRLTPFILAMLMAVMAFSQNIPSFDQSRVKTPASAEFLLPGDALVVAPLKDAAGPMAFAPDEFIIGSTWYDLQTNKGVQNRIYRWDDGSIGAVWTMGMEASAFPDRGTGYNFFDGSAWGSAPAARLESVRAGWPSYSPLGENGELVIAHDFGALGLVLNHRENKGTGEWIESAYSYTNGPSGLAWPRHITAGPDHNSIHLMANSYDEYMGMTTAQVYSRSTDGGATWDIQNEIIDGMGVDDYLDLAADEIVWADPAGETIAFLCFGAWHDLFMMKSSDNGDTWEKTVIWEHPYPFFDWNTTIADTFFCVDNSAAIALSPDGKAHVAFGISRVMHLEVGTTYQYFPYVEGIGYWNEDMPAFSNDLAALAPPQYGYANSEMVEDVNYIGWMQDVDGDGEITLTDEIMSYRSLGPCTMPSLLADEYGNVIVLFAATTETYFNDTYNYKHIWARAYNGTTESWGDFYDLTSDIVHIFDECIYPQLALNSDDNIYYFYNADLTPGLALDEDHAYEENRQIFASLEKTYFGLPVGVGEINENQAIVVSQNYPNPASESTSFRITMEETGHVRVEVSNITGQVVQSFDQGSLNAGDHVIRLDLSDLHAGTYFYTVITDQYIVSKQMIIK